VYETPLPRRHRRGPSPRHDLGIAVLLTIAALAALGTWNLFGGALAAAIDPQASVAIASPPIASEPSAGEPGSSEPIAAAPFATASAAPNVTPDPSTAPAASPEPSATPKPRRVAMNVKVDRNPNGVFISEQLKTWCAASAVQMVLNVNGPRINVTASRQRQIHFTEVSLTTRTDSHNGGVGPLGMVATLNRMGRVKYEFRTYRTRAAAIRVTAKAITTTGHPVIWLAWRGAHAWVITGYRANADPTVFSNAAVSGVYVLDPWYPRVSSIWGPSDPPGTFQDAAEMQRNYLGWKRPDGHYASRDGKFLMIVPVGTPKD
jgi:hypothetical protein